MGAWIETHASYGDNLIAISRTLTWVRGLKHTIHPWLDRQIWSHPYMGAWIETKHGHVIGCNQQGRTLTWVRGLKPFFDDAMAALRYVAPLHGCVD